MRHCICVIFVYIKIDLLMGLLLLVRGRDMSCRWLFFCALIMTRAFGVCASAPVGGQEPGSIALSRVDARIVQDGESFLKILEAYPLVLSRAALILGPLHQAGLSVKEQARACRQLLPLTKRNFYLGVDRATRAKALQCAALLIKRAGMARSFLKQAGPAVYINEAVARAAYASLERRGKRLSIAGKILGITIGSLALGMLGLLFIGHCVVKTSKPTSEFSLTLSEPVTLDDVAIDSELKTTLEEWVNGITTSAPQPNAVGYVPPRNLLLYGPPGNGKTTVAKAVAGMIKGKMFYSSASGLQGQYLGQGSERVKRLFEDARREKPSVIFIDELDAFANRAQTHNVHDESRRVTTELLTQMDGMNNNDGVYIIAATNNLAALDEALVRSERFGNHILVGNPNEQGCLFILRRELNKSGRQAGGVQEALPKVAGQLAAAHCSGADVVAVVAQARQNAYREKASMIAPTHINNAAVYFLQKRRPRTQLPGQPQIPESGVQLLERGHNLATAPQSGLRQ